MHAVFTAIFHGNANLSQVSEIPSKYADLISAAIASWSLSMVFEAYICAGTTVNSNLDVKECLDWLELVGLGYANYKLNKFI